MDLPLISAGVVALAILLYVVLDGFDLGVGILFPFTADADERGLIMSTIAPVWDGNETWLILGGAVLFGAFPLAYAVALPAFYLPLFAMLAALIFRGAGFELRVKAHRKGPWDVLFCAGSTLAAFCQGLLLGGLIQGVTVKDGMFAGGTFDWLTPLGLVAGIGVVGGYALLGATWLVLKTEGELQRKARGWSRLAVATVIAAMGVVSLVTPWLHAAVAERWFGGTHFLYLWPVPAAAGAAALALWVGVARGWERAPFLLAVALFLLGFVGIAVSLWPNLVPPSLTIWSAAAPRMSQLFVLVGVAICLPMILGYTWYAYRVFRGKVRAGEGYGH